MGELNYLCPPDYLSVRHPTDLPDRHGPTGSDQTCSKTCPEPLGCHTLSKPEAGTDFEATGEGGRTEGAERPADEHSRGTSRNDQSHETGNQPSRDQRMSSALRSTQPRSRLMTSSRRPFLVLCRPISCLKQPLI